MLLHSFCITAAYFKGFVLKYLACFCCIFSQFGSFGGPYKSLENSAQEIDKRKISELTLLDKYVTNRANFYVVL